MLKRGQRLLGLWVLLGHGAYLRPSSNMALRRGGLVPPVPGLTEHWGLLLHQSQHGERSKTGSQDDSLMWDVPEL
eukprot:2335305-Alexandrium_andersonii.AAC.1